MELPLLKSAPEVSLLGHEVLYVKFIAKFEKTFIFITKTYYYT
jgi:hypothetical protein